MKSGFTWKFASRAVLLPDLDHLQALAVEGGVAVQQPPVGQVRVHEVGHSAPVRLLDGHLGRQRQLRELLQGYLNIGIPCRPPDQKETKSWFQFSIFLTAF